MFLDARKTLKFQGSSSILLFLFNKQSINFYAQSTILGLGREKKQCKR